MTTRRNLFALVAGAIAAPFVAKAAPFAPPIEEENFYLEGMGQKIAYDMIYNENKASEVAGLLCRANEIYEDIVWKDGASRASRYTFTMRTPVGPESFERWS